MQESLLSVRNLCTHFLNNKKIVRAVDGVSFDVRRGEILGLVGESGCGKSATCRSLIRLIQSSGEIVNGQILYDGRDIVRMSEREMNQIRNDFSGTDEYVKSCNHSWNTAHRSISITKIKAQGGKT